MPIMILLISALFSCSTPQPVAMTATTAPDSATAIANPGTSEPENRTADSGSTNSNSKGVVQPDEVTTKRTASPEQDPRYQIALEFDQFLAGKLSTEEEHKLEDRCHANPTTSVFCFSILNRDTFEQKLRSKATRSLATSKNGGHNVRPKFKRGKLVNWDDLRFSSISTIIKGLGSASPNEISQLKKLAQRETRCPNNVAVAVAAQLEDLLPDRVDFEELADLYERGGDCLVKAPGDRENLLTRSGLFYYAKKDYKNAARVFRRSASIDNIYVGRPLYWLMRSHQLLKNRSEANSAFKELKEKYPFSFHTLISLITESEDPGEILKIHRDAHITRSTKVPMFNHLLEEVEVLHELGFEQSASKVLDWAIADSQGIEPALMVYLAELKKEQGDYHTKIQILSDVLYKHPTLISKETMELYFPKVFFPVFEKHASVVDPYLLLAIARRESAFRTKIVSSANAVGLLQVLPSTGKTISQSADLKNPDSNVEVGARYILELLKKVNGQIHLALAAYNAGPNRLFIWTSRYPLEEPILFIDLIPYRETREYVASIMRNYYWYRRIHQGEDKETPRKLLELATTKGE